MIDYFLLFNESPRPWIDPESLKNKFLALSTQLHPDRQHGQSNGPSTEFSDLNTAYQILREPKDRLLHLLELELGAKPGDIQRIPPGTMDLFVEIGQLCRDIDGFLAKAAPSDSPLMKVKLFQQSQEWTEKLQSLQGKISAKRELLFDQLRQLNSNWEMVSLKPMGQRKNDLPLDHLEQIYRVLSYISRWTGQIQERFVQLSSLAF